MYCPWEAPELLIFSSNIPSFLLYSHGVAILSSLILGFFLIKSNKNRLNFLFLILSLFFSFWAFSDVLQWATNRPDRLLFFWSLNILIEPLIYIISLYILYIFIKNTEPKIFYKIAFFLPIIPILVLIPTNILLPGVDINYCNAIESDFIVKYSYGLQAFYIISIVLFGFFSNFFDKTNVKQNRLLTVGIFMFLLAFSSGNIIGSLTDNWQAAQFGLFGMPIFIGFISFLIVKYKAFDTKVISSQILVFSSWFLVFAILFIRRIEQVRIVVVFTLVFVGVIGWLLVKGIKREIKQKEELEILSNNLFEANEKLKGLDKLKTEFLSLATHQIRSPLTAIKGYTSMLLEGSFGKIDNEKKEPLERVLQTSNSLAIMVEDFLSVSKIESGGMKYMIEPFDFRKMVEDTYSDLKVTAEKKGLVMEFNSKENEPIMVSGDREKLRQVIINLTDNSIKYTPTGSISIDIEVESHKTIFSVKDTGVGVSPETKSTLFGKFSRGEGAKLNTTGSGLGLYLAKEIIKAHHGKVWLESEGLGKGTTFFVELPTIPKE